MRALSLLADLSRTRLRNCGFIRSNWVIRTRLSSLEIRQLACAPQARAILECLQKLSKPFRTQIAIENDVGVIRLSPQ